MDRNTCALRCSPRLAGNAKEKAIVSCQKEVSCKQFTSPVTKRTASSFNTAGTPLQSRKRWSGPNTPDAHHSWSPMRNGKENSADGHPKYRSNAIYPKIQKCGTLCELPEDIWQKYSEKRKVKQLYDWQKECLSDHRLMRGSNFIISLPTGAGKTLIAEMLMLREAIVKKRNSILVLPYVAIVQEKIGSLAVFEKEFDIRVEEYAGTKGRIPPIKRRTGNSVYVCTIEKANMLINCLIEMNRLTDIGLVVVDELHMIGDGSRGAIIEQQLTKFLDQGAGQVVGLSATLSNMAHLEKFLTAYTFSTDFRPVELKEYVKLGNTMWKITDGNLTEPRDLAINKLSNHDPQGICQMLEGVIPRQSVIIFCPTKKSCENLAVLLAKLIPKKLRDMKMEEKLNLLEAIKEDNDGKVCSQLETALYGGVAYHHSGLTHDERKHIEAAYTEGVLCVICATSTLAAGVNLPARRVIIRAPMVGMDFMKKAQYLQMIGRAGRAGFDSKGDSITVVKPGLEERQFRNMLKGPLLSCESSLTVPDSLTSFILDIVSLKMANTVEQLMTVLSRTLLYVQTSKSTVVDLLQHSLSTLQEKDLIDIKENVIYVTQLGVSTFDANLEPERASFLRKELVDSLNKGIVFSTHFHLLFTIAPYDCCCAVDWHLFHSEYNQLSVSEKELLARSGLPEGTIINCFRSQPKLSSGDSAMRLYVAMILLHIWNQESHADVSERFGVDRGWMQSVLHSAIAQAAAIARFSEKQKTLWPLRLLLPELVQRLSDCSRAELIPLLEIDGVRRGRAIQLFSAGYKNIASIANADYNDLTTKIENLKKFQAMRIVNSAKNLLRDKTDEKLEELENYGVNISNYTFK